MTVPDFDVEATLAYATKVRDILLTSGKSRVLDLPDNAFGKLLVYQQAHFDNAAELQAELAIAAGMDSVSADTSRALRELVPELTSELRITLAAIQGAEAMVEKALDEDAWTYAKANLEF